MDLDSKTRKYFLKFGYQVFECRGKFSLTAISRNRVCLIHSVANKRPLQDFQDHLIAYNNFNKKYVRKLLVIWVDYVREPEIYDIITNKGIYLIANPKL